jgi:ABC-type phosphate transport system substrate-binding protein
LRIVSKLIIAATAAATIAAMAAGPALADPPSGTTPKPADIVGVGSDTIQFVFDQFSHDYNASSHSGGNLYSWDATNPSTGAIGDTVVLKGTSSDHTTCALARPNGSSGGITALETTNKTISGHPCIDFARSSRARGSTDPNTISFVTLAGDAVGYASEPAAGGGKSNVPTNLTTAELAAIYSCKVNNWNQLPGGGNGKPAIFIPQASSGTRSFFLSAIGVAAPGPCASDLPTKAVPTGTLEENEGVNPAFAKNPQNVIYPYSIGKYLAQRFHSGSCGTHCFKQPTKCSHTGKNLFGCDVHGNMQLNKVNGTNPTSPFPPVATSKINKNFSTTFQRTLFEVVVNPTPGSGFGIPTYLKPLFGPTGFTCTNSKAKTDLGNYGFRVLKAGATPRCAVDGRAVDANSSLPVH